MKRWLARWGRLDKRVSNWVTSTDLPGGPRLLLSLLTHSGDSHWWLLGGFLAWFIGEGALVGIGRRVVAVVLLSGAVSTVIKQIVRRTRPAGDQGLFYLNLDRYSFPSGHATRIGALMVSLGVVILPGWAAVLWMWGVAVGISRVVLGVHYVSDIMAGMAVGALVGGIVAVLGW